MTQATFRMLARYDQLCSEPTFEQISAGKTHRTVGRKKMRARQKRKLSCFGKRISGCVFRGYGVARASVQHSTNVQHSTLQYKQASAHLAHSTSLLYSRVARYICGPVPPTFAMVNIRNVDLSLRVGKFYQIFVAWGKKVTIKR